MTEFDGVWVARNGWYAHQSLCQARLDENERVKTVLLRIDTQQQQPFDRQAEMRTDPLGHLGANLPLVLSHNYVVPMLS